MARPKANTEKVTVFFSPEVLEMLRSEAEKRGMSISGLVRMIVLKYFSAEK